MLTVETNARTEPSQSARFGIPAHIHVCVTATGSVILDVKRNKYLGIDSEQTQLLANAVVGWPMRPPQRDDCHFGPAATDAQSALCELLAADGVLERIIGTEEARAVTVLQDMRKEWISIGDELEVQGRVKLREVVRFLRAYCWARFSLAWRPFSSVVEKVRMTKGQGRRDLQECNVLRLAATVDVFRRIRPFVFAAEGHCLLHALTLLRFLHHHQMHPDWVIGVNTQPWGAHSWVQWDRYLLDSTPEKACGYMPIMIV